MALRTVSTLIGRCCIAVTVIASGAGLTFAQTAPATGHPAPTPQTAASKVAAPPAFARVTSVEGITEYRLPNRLRVLLFPDLSKRTVTVNMTYLVGFRHENYGETGMAHLLERLLFKGSKNFPNVPKAFSDHGAYWNGTTWTDRTNYFETVPATDANLLEQKVDQLTLDDIVAAMRRHLDPSKISVVKAGDFSKVKTAAGQL